MNQIKYSLWLKKWHTRLGLAVAAVLAMLCVTGALINHASDLSLEKKVLPKAIASLSYGLSETLIQIETLDNIQVRSYDNKFDVFLLSSTQKTTKQKQSKTCSEELVSIARFGSELWIACTNEISIFVELDNKLLFVEQINTYNNLPHPISQFGACNSLPCLVSDGTLFQYQENSGLWNEEKTAPDNSGGVNITAPNKTSASSSTSKVLVPSELNWYRWLLDLHAGRLFGQAGVFLIDLSAIIILLMIFTGISRWWLTRARQ